MELSLIIINWNSTAYLRECIASIYVHTIGVAFEIIVVDNASPDGDVDVLKEQFPGIILIKSPNNVGFARANNLGFKASTGRYVVLLNPDTLLLNSAFNLMLRQASSVQSPGVMGCTLLNEDRSIQTTAIQTFPNIINQLLDANFLRDRFPSCRLWDISPLFSSKTGPRSVEVISGACLMLRREVFVRVGLFSEDYFMYAEDLDLCYKAVCAGFVNYYLPEGKILHYGGKSSNPRTAIVLKWRSILRYLAKYRGHGYVFLFRLVISCGALVRLAALIVCSPARLSLHRRARSAPLSKWWLVLRTMLTRSERFSPADDFVSANTRREEALPATNHENAPV